jgi:hypothetical protein
VPDTGADVVADQRGAIMVIGVFMAVLLVGFMYFVIGVGETVFYRERMQDASDASAWASAVLHARGMNAIVLLNMIMAAITAIVLMVKAIKLIVDIGIGIATIACWSIKLSWLGCPAKAFLSGTVRPAVVAAERFVDNFAKTVLPVLNKAAHGVKWATPWVAQVKTLRIAGAYKPPAQLGIFVSGTLFNGLPVEDDECSVLERRASEYLEGLIRRALDTIPVIGRPVGWILGKIAAFAGRAGAAVYGGVCGGGISGADEFIESVVSEAGSDMRREQCNSDGTPKSLPERSPGESDAAYAEKVRRAHAFCRGETTEDPMEGLGGDSSSSGGGRRNIAPLRVKGDCKLGAECMQVRSIVIGKPDYERTLQGVQVANWGRASTSGQIYSQLAELGRGSVAQAEFYWHSIRGPDGADRERDWMWEMNWRARLRRFRIPAGSLLGSVCGEGGGGGFCGALIGAADMINSVIVH